jgi:hypothetical protein
MTTEKVQMPDGKGGFEEVEADKFSDGAAANVNKQQDKLNEEKQKAHEERVGSAAEAFNRYHKAYATDYGISEEELVKAVYLELLNLKEFYPADLGGEKRFDEMTEEVFAWFEQNKNKP